MTEKVLYGGSATTTDILRRQRVEVKLDPTGKLVELHIGEFWHKLDYLAALRIAAWLRLVGTQAKKRSGDFTKTVTAIGMLEDAEFLYKKGWDK